jgi:uncharacterized hydrophobic protein (TIGR00271 family)
LDKEQFDIKVVVDRLKHRGIVKCFDEHDLVIAGTDASNYLNPLRQSLTNATVAVVKRIPPLRLKSWPEWLPHINPSDHAELLHDLRQGSRWSPDFVVMLALASAIASLGLLQNSAAVVIGSMLLAPLMTPMIGMGLALNQANVALMRLCGKSILLGFSLTLLISFLIGSITPFGETLSEEILARGEPNVLDLLIALFAAVAAAFAMARPGIAGAIAGVAIATALVPPACAVGLSLACGDPLNAAGAAVLFLSNLLAIILASSFTFLVLGISASKAIPRHLRLARASQIGLFLLLVALVGPLSTKLVTQIGQGKNVTLAYPVTRAVSRAINTRVARDPNVEIMSIARPRASNSVLIHLASSMELPSSYANDLRAIVRDVMDDPELPVTVIAVRGLWRSDEDVSEQETQ